MIEPLAWMLSTFGGRATLTWAFKRWVSGPLKDWLVWLPVWLRWQGVRWVVCSLLGHVEDDRMIEPVSDAVDDVPRAVIWDCSRCFGHIVTRPWADCPSWVQAQLLTQGTEFWRNPL